MNVVPCSLIGTSNLSRQDTIIERCRWRSARSYISLPDDGSAAASATAAASAAVSDDGHIFPTGTVVNG